MGPKWKFYMQNFSDSATKKKISKKVQKYVLVYNYPNLP